MLRHRNWIAAGAIVVAGLAAALVVYAARGGSDAGATEIPQASAARLTAAGLDGLPLAPTTRRVDVAVPSFSNPTEVTNPLFPISDLRSAVLAGQVDGKPFKVETTLLPHTRIVQWPDGRRLETLVSQYVAYSDGRIKEVALDFYAQADDGSVWYLGEDVFNYEDGAIADTEGTWIAGQDGPGAMIMPADPKVGDAYRPENVPGLVFEEVRVKAVDRKVAGPRGAVEGAIVAGELHQDGAREDKIFAPGYGEFLTGSDGDVEALALAVPTDSLVSRPRELETLASGADAIFEGSADAHARVRRMAADWRRLEDDAPPRLVPAMRRGLDRLAQAVEAGQDSAVRQAAVEVAQATLDLELRHRPSAEVDRGRFRLWARQLMVDAKTGDSAAVRGDLAVLEWIRDRFVHTLGPVDVTRIDARLLVLRDLLNEEDLPGAARAASRLQRAVS